MACLCERNHQSQQDQTGIPIIKNIKNDVGMSCQKVCKQGRDDIIVKVNLQSPIPTSFYITVAN